MKRAGKRGRAGAALLLSALLAVSLAAVGGGVGASPAQAADGRGAGKSLLIGVAADGFDTKGTDKIDIVPDANPKYPGTVRFTKTHKSGYVSCLSTDRRNYLQWTGCNSDLSKQWVIEPLDAKNAGANGSSVGTIDNTEAAVNVRAGSVQPRFVIRNFKYPDLCVASKKSGFKMPDAAPANLDERKFLTDKCSASDTDANLRTQFAIMNDVDGVEWEFLRQQMTAGAQALAARKMDSWFSGSNLWVKPLDAQGNSIAATAGASTDGYFSPNAIAVDPQFRSAIVSTQSVARDCAAGGLWWSVYNGTSNPLARDIGTQQQHTDSTDYGISVTASGSWESPGSTWSPAGKWTFGLEVGGSVNWAKSDSKTKSDSINYTIPAKRYGMAVVSTETMTVRGLWKSGTALNRVWNVPGILSVATKSKDGVPQSELAAYEGNEQKSCLAAGPTMIADGEPFEVALPTSRVAPVVGDTVTADATFVEPATQAANPLDVRYQWYADKDPIVGQTSRELVVRPGYAGKQLSFSAYENGGAMRFESQLYSSLQTAPVLAQAADAMLTGLQGAPATVALPDGIAGLPYKFVLGNVEGIADTVTLDPAQLPPGLAFDAATETISGTPTQVGHFDLALETAAGDALIGTLVIDAAPTVWPEIRGKAVRVGATFALPLVSQIGTDASYQIDFMSADGQPVPMPAGVRITSSGGDLTVEGTIANGGEWLIRATELSPYPDAGDGRATSNTVTLSVDADAALLYADGAEIEVPLDSAASLQLAEVPLGLDPVLLAGALPTGMSFEPATGVLSGTPTAAGRYSLQFGPTADGDSASIEIVVFDKPVVAAERQAADPAADLTAGEPGEWGITAPNADAITAEVRPKNGGAAVDWAALSMPGVGEAALEVLPDVAGEYVIEITASNAAGTSLLSVPFTVAAAHSGGGGSEGGDHAGGSGSGTAADPLASTGFDVGAAVLAGILAVVAGGVLLLARRGRSGQRL